MTIVERAKLLWMDVDEYCAYTREKLEAPITIEACVALLGAALEQAFHDLEYGTRLERDDAYTWLTDGNGQWAADVLGLDVEAGIDRVRARRRKRRLAANGFRVSA